MLRDRILLVDEDPNVLTSCKILLDERGFDVETAQNRAQALSHLSRMPFSILITEYSLEHVDTRDIIRRVKGASPETSIIIVTGAPIDEILHEELVDLGISDLFFKPFPIEGLIIAVKKAVRTRQLIVGAKRLRKQLELAKTRFREVSDGYLLDPLTGSPECQIYNNRYLRDRFNSELKRARRHNRCLSLMLMSLTSPEKVKGLPARKTNQYLKEMAKVVRRNTRAEDTVGRHGLGLALILPETESGGTECVIRRLKGLIHDHLPFVADPKFKQLNRRLRFSSHSYPEQLEIPALE
jgi:diguanylate cyclase (GGDEF)-like protein